MGISKSLFDGKMEISLGLNNLFDRGGFQMTIEEPLVGPFDNGYPAASEFRDVATDRGGRALMSMRLEKNWGAWTLDFRPDFTAKESSLDVFINWNKEFIGKESAKKDNSNLKLTPLIVETDDIDVCNNEAVMKDGKSIGYVTSGGFAVW